MEQENSVRVEWENGQIVIYDPYAFVSQERLIAPIKIIQSREPDRHYAIVKTRKGGYLFK